MEEEKTIDIVVQEYEEKIKNLNEENEQKIKDLKEEHAKEIRMILTGKKIDTSKNVGNEEEQKEDFFTSEIRKTKKLLKIKEEEN